MFESEAAYLERHELVTGEQRQAARRCFAPVRVRGD